MTSDLHISVLLEGLAPARRTRIVDVGANPLDAPPYAALLARGGCDVVGFEPQPEALARLMATRSPRETYLPHAVGDGGTCDFKIYRSPGFSSVHDPDVAAMRLLGRPGWAQVAERVPMQTVTLDSDPRTRDFDLLKIDIQGGECDVFRGARQALAGAVAVIVELRWLRLYQGEPMAAGVDADLRGMGFALHKFLFNKSLTLPNSQSHRLRPRRMRDQLIDGDAVYVRDLTRLDALGSDQIRHLAILAASVFVSHSLVLCLLDELVRRGDVAAGLPSAYADALPAELQQAEAAE